MQRRRLFILSTGHNSGVPKIFEWGAGKSREWGQNFFVFLLKIAYLDAFWHTFWLNHIVYHGRWTFTNENRKVTDTSILNPDARLLLAEATRNAFTQCKDSRPDLN